MNFRQFLWAFRYPVLVFIINELFLRSVYQQWDWFDIPMHVLGGFVIALAAQELLGILQKEGKFSASALVRIIVVVSFVALIAVVWEWHEYARTVFLGAPLNTYEDTLSDLFFGITGGFIATLWNRFRAI